MLTRSSAIAAAAGSLKFVKASHRAFSVLDLTISYPLVPESISISTVALVALVALSIVIGFGWTQVLKQVFPKPRPHFLALCQPLLDNVNAHVVGGYGQDISARWTLVDASICATANSSVLDDGFRSFPSGHCSFSWSGLLYLSLFLCAKFSIAVPYLPITVAPVKMQQGRNTTLLPLHNINPGQASSQDNKSPSPPPVDPSESVMSIYNQTADAPKYLLLLAFVPPVVATYIASTRYTEYWHFGFDVLSGSLIGIASAWFAFRWHHLPIRRGQGWAWGPRSMKRAFGIGVGVGSYVGPELWSNDGSVSERDAARSG
jgi:membrane-associated phospholipid phosphatase